MPRLTDRTPAYSLHRRSGKARVCIDGRQIFLGPYGTPESRAEYDRIVGEWLANGRRLPVGERGGPSDVTIAELALRYWRFAETYYRKDGKPTTEVGNIRAALRPVLDQYGHTAACAFGPLALKAVRQTWVDAGLIRKAINARVGRVLRFFRWAVENELIPPAVHQSLKAVPGLRKGRSEAKEGTPIRPVPDAQVDACRPFVGRQVWAMIALQRITAMRPGEVMRMRTGDIDRAGDVWIYTPPGHKTEHHEKARQVYLGPRAQELLREWLKADPDAHLFSPVERLAEQSVERRAGRRSPMTPSQRARTSKRRPKRTPRECYTVASYRRAISRACERAGVPSWHPHQLRHNAATGIRREFGLDVARVLLGHSSPIVTEIYAELDLAKALEAARRVG
jgi:integrase